MSGPQSHLYEIAPMVTLARIGLPGPSILLEGMVTRLAVLLASPGRGPRRLGTSPSTGCLGFQQPFLRRRWRRNQALNGCRNLGGCGMLPVLRNLVRATINVGDWDCWPSGRDLKTVVFYNSPGTSLYLWLQRERIPLTLDGSSGYQWQGLGARS